MSAADYIPLNFPILFDARNWLFVAFIVFLVGALVHYLAPHLLSQPTAQEA